ncbi:MAG: RdgB/HAM1 family non-canonical purine NTP pyrophosphatase [Pseudanabaenaceae cyanobacterium]
MKNIRRLVIASGNQGKVREFMEYFRGEDWHILPKPPTVEVAETGTTFLENACLKAQQVAIATGLWALADDSGLVVDALDGAPGIYSARYGPTDTLRIHRVLQELHAKGENVSRSARFVCAIAVANPQGQIVNQAVGVCEGMIIEQPRGDHGFGYDPIFYVPEYQLTFAEMSSELKNQISHRAKALAELRSHWQICTNG